MSGQLGNILVFVIIRVVERDRDYLLIELAAILHHYNAYRIAAHKGHGVYLFAAYDHYVERVAVIAVGLGIKP